MLRLYTSRSRTSSTVPLRFASSVGKVPAFPQLEAEDPYSGVLWEGPNSGAKAVPRVRESKFEAARREYGRELTSIRRGFLEERRALEASRERVDEDIMVDEERIAAKRAALEANVAWNARLAEVKARDEERRNSRVKQKLKVEGRKMRGVNMHLAKVQFVESKSFLGGAATDEKGLRAMIEEMVDEVPESYNKPVLNVAHLRSRHKFRARETRKPRAPKPALSVDEPFA